MLRRKSSASEIDRVLLAHCARRWLKVARIVARTFDTFEQRAVQITAAAIDARMKALVAGRRLEAKGNTRNWRYSEVQLPGRIDAAE